MKRYYFIAVVFFVMFTLGCGKGKRVGIDPVRFEVPKEKQQLQEINKYLSQKEQDVLEAYTIRQQLKTVKASDGSYYDVVKKGKGATIADGDGVVLHGKFLLLDGTVCYTFDKKFPFELIIGGSRAIPGLHNGLKGMKEGSRVIFVFPSNLAYGLLGDGDKIPPKNSLVCDVEIIEVVKRKN